MLCKVYYRDFLTKKLHQINVEETHPALAITAVAMDLAASNEPYHKPILALIQGGKQ